MKQADIFLFPSFAEGSARVIFEAMAAGCYIITTNNSGSIVKDGIHGAIIDPISFENLFVAIDFAINSPNIVSEVGNFNSKHIRNNYMQKDYSRYLIDFYKEVKIQINNNC